MKDSLIRLVLVGVSAVPAFALGFWAGLSARRARRGSAAREIAQRELPAPTPPATHEDTAQAPFATPFAAEQSAQLGDVRPLRPAAEQGRYPKPLE